MTKMSATKRERFDALAIRVMSLIVEMQARGLSVGQMVAELTSKRISAAPGGVWTPSGYAACWRGRHHQNQGDSGRLDEIGKVAD